MCLENTHVCNRARQCEETDMLHARNRKCKNTVNKLVFIKGLSYAVKLWFKHCATSRKVTALIPDGVIAIFY